MQLCTVHRVHTNFTSITTVPPCTILVSLTVYRGRHQANSHSISLRVPLPTMSSLLSWLAEFDKILSRPLFQAQVFYPVELLWSIPGNFFGIPFFSCLIAPCCITLLESKHRPVWLVLTVCMLFFSMINLWWGVLGGNAKATRIFYGPVLGALSAPAGVFLLNNCSSEHMNNSSGYFCIAAWCLSVLPVAILKPWIARARPILYEGHNDKHLTTLLSILLKDSHASFPSGDAAGAVAAAYSLIKNEKYAKWAIACMVTTLAGRVYWKAHSVGDVLVGAWLALIACRLLEAIVDGGFEWHHAFASWSTLIMVVIVSRWRSKTKIFASGTIPTTGNGKLV